MYQPNDIHQRLLLLKSHLDRVNRAWTPNDYEHLMMFFVDVLPKLMQAQRCSIFIADRESDHVWLKFGTGVQEKQIEAPKLGSIVGEALHSGAAIIQNNLENKFGFHTIADQKNAFFTYNLICVPIKSLFQEEYIGAVEVLNKLGGEPFTQEDEQFLKRVVKYLSLSIESYTVSAEIIGLTKLMHEDIQAREKRGLGIGPIIAESPGMRRAIELTQKVGTLPINVFITGESGTGKEVIARMIHQLEDRRSRPFVAVNCSSIPEHLMESEFFGYEKGAFTGATGSRMGRFEEANGGTLFLDEISDMPISIQPKFLRAIQENEGVRLGSNKLQKYQFRLISASAKDLREEVEQGRFREDLFFRLFAVDIVLPPLRERKEDIIPLALMFLEQTNIRFKKKVAGFSATTLDMFERFSWPGNVRQLLHEVERLVALTADGEIISADNCSSKLHELEEEKTKFTPDTLSLPIQRKNLEVQLIQQALLQTGGNKIKAASLLEITRQSLHNKIRQYNLNIP
ncbi:MAG: sigma-54-dependent Fis family transcriptional regulator [Magnetococcus sp. DMHC-6]